MADNPYVGDVHQGPSSSGEMSGNPYAGDAHQGASGATQPNNSAEGRTASSEWGSPTAADSARHEPGAIAHYQN